MPRRVVSSPMAFNRVPGGLRAVAPGCLLVNCGLSLPTITPSSATRQITTADPFSYQTPQGVKCQTRDFLDIAAQPDRGRRAGPDASTLWSTQPPTRPAKGERERLRACAR